MLLPHIGAASEVGHTHPFFGRCDGHNFCYNQMHPDIRGQIWAPLWQPLRGGVMPSPAQFNLPLPPPQGSSRSGLALSENLGCCQLDLPLETPLVTGAPWACGLQGVPCLLRLLQRLSCPPQWVMANPRLAAAPPG